MGTDSFQSHLLLLKAKDLEGESGLNEQQSKRGIKRVKKKRIRLEIPNHIGQYEINKMNKETKV